MNQSDMYKIGKSFAMTHCDKAKSAAQGGLSVCAMSESVAQGGLSVCAMSESVAQSGLSVSALSKSAAQSGLSVCDMSESVAQGGLSVSATQHGTMQFFTSKRTIRGSRTLHAGAMPVPALLPRQSHFEGSKCIHPKTTVHIVKTITQAIEERRDERRERHYGCGWPANYSKMKNLTLASNCHTSEVSAVATRLVALYQGMEFAEDSFLTNAMTGFVSLSERITAAVDRSVRAAYDTEDRNRSQCLRQFHHLLVGSQSSQDAVVRNSANAISAVFKPCGLAVLHKGLDEKTGHINALLADLDEAAMQQHVANISGMPGCIAQLREAQAAFEAKRADYQSRRGAMRSSASATELKGLIREQLNTVLIPYFQVMDSVKGGSYAEFNTTLREVIASANATANQRRGRKKASAPDETQAEPRQTIEEGGLSA